MAATRLERLWKHFDAFAPLLAWAVVRPSGAVLGRTPTHALYWRGGCELAQNKSTRPLDAPPLVSRPC